MSEKIIDTADQTAAPKTAKKKEVLDSLAPVIEQHPLIASLVVSDETLPADRIKVKTPGNLLYVNYHKLAKGMK